MRRRSHWLLVALILVAVAWIVLARRREHARAPGKTTISFYGQDARDDNGRGFSGVNLLAFNSSSLKWNGKPVFPVAVLQKDWPTYAYKVLRIAGAGTHAKKIRPIYGVVLDVCASKDAICRKNSKKHGFLVDVHRAGFGAIGERTGLFDGEFEVVGSLSAADIPDRLWHPDVVRGKDYMQCRRSGGSLGWVPLKNRRGMCAASTYLTF